MNELTDFGTGEIFRCHGDTKSGTLIFHDRALSGYSHIPGGAHRDLLRDFAGREVTLAEIQRWTHEKLGFKRELAGQIAAILIAEGLASASNGKVRFGAAHMKLT